jgi:hypothetical protein
MAGCLLSLGGQLLLARRTYELTAETLPQGRLQVALLQPVEAISVQINGPDPFRTLPEECALRFIATTRAGRTVTSEISRRRLSLNIPAARPGTVRRDFREYIVLWQSVIDGATDEESRAVTARIHNLNEWRLFDRIEAAIVLRSDKRVLLPDALRISTITDPSIELFDGAGTRHEVVQQERGRVYSFHDPASPALSDRLTGWGSLGAYWGPRRGLDMVASVPLGAGVLFLAVGIGLMLQRAVSRSDRVVPTSSDESRDGTSPLGAETRGAPSPSSTPCRPLAALFSVLVWGTWAVMLIASLALVARHGSNHPWADDWFITPHLLGIEPLTWSWLWGQWNVHRIPLPKLVHVVLFRLTGDFRASMYFNVIVLGGLAWAMIWAARRLRGWTSITDAFFPLVLLSLAHSQNELFHFGLQLASSLLFMGAVLVFTLRAGERGSIAAEVGVGICLVLLPLCGGIGLCFVPAVAIWLGYAGFARMRAAVAAPTHKRWGLFLVGLALFAAVFAVGTGASARVSNEQRAFVWPAGIGRRLAVALQFLALSLGPAYSRFWPLSATAIPILFFLSLTSLVLTSVRRATGRVRVLGLVSFLASTAVLTVAFAWGRAGFIPEHELLGLDHVHGLRYTTIAVPVVCAIYLSWSLMGPPALARCVHVGLFLLTLAIAPTNVALGLAWANGLRHGFEAVEADIKAGLPAFNILARNRGSYSLPYGRDSYIIEQMQELRTARIGLYPHLKPDPPFRIVALPLAPSAAYGLEMEPEAGKGHVTGLGGYLTFCLPRSTNVGLIRFRATHSDPTNRLRLRWERGGGPDSSASKQITDYFPIGNEVIAIADIVDEFHIYPGDKPGDFQISDLELLVPADDESVTAQGLGAGGRKG